MSRQFSSQAQNQALGYLYQVRYALLLLLKSGLQDSDSQISIEYLDDIAFEKDGTPIELIQAKHHVKKASLSDSSPDVWRTLRVCCERILQGKLQLESITLTLITTEHAADNTAAYRLRPQETGCRNVKEARDILVSIAQSSVNKTNALAYNAFLSLTQDQQFALLHQVQVLDQSPDILDTQKEITNYLSYTTRQKFLLGVHERLEGWWFATVIKHLYGIPLNEQVPLVIPNRDLRAAIHDIQDEFREDALPIDYPDDIKIHDEDVLADKRLFVEQLRIIGVNTTRLQKAISDFYRASEQRSRWIREGILLHQELEKYEARLCDEWERSFASMEEDLDINPPEDDMKKRGRELFNEIQKATLYIRSRCTEAYIMRGSYHILADSLHVGWHLQFHERLKSFIA